MAKYTTQLRTIIEYNSTPGKPITDRIKEAAHKIFDFDFPMWLESYRETLEYKILLHYFSNEIGFETVGLWKLYLNQRLNEIMPYYNDVYLTTTDKFSSAYDMDVTETLQRTLTGADNTSTEVNGESTDTTTTTAKDNTQQLNSNYPQAQVEGNQNNLFYGTTGTNEDATSNSNTQNQGTNKTNSKSQGNSQTTEQHTIQRKGITGSRTPWEIAQSYRNSIINIDVQVINALKDLFMMIY